MSITVFKKWTRAVSYLDEKIKNSRLIAGRNIQLENTGNGIRIHGSVSGFIQSGDTYTGYFKVIKDGDTYSVVDGANPDATSCGYVIIGNSRVAVPKKTALSVGEVINGAFYLETTYTSSYQISIKFASSLPAAENGKDIGLVADLIDGNPVQRLYGEYKIVRWV